MSKTWYPVIDYKKCRECGACAHKCSHGVYDKGKAPRPAVVSPEACAEGCAGCGDACPYGAITYFGDRELSVPVYTGSPKSRETFWGVNGGECGGCGREEKRGCEGCGGCGQK